MRLFTGNIVRAGDDVVLILSVQKRGMYVVECSIDGNIKETANIIYVMSPKSSDFKLLSHVDMKQTAVVLGEKSYTWSELNPKMFSMVCFKLNAEMSQLDDRFKLFLDTASEKQISLFREYEDKNMHAENGHFIRLYAEFFHLNNERGL